MTACGWRPSEIAATEWWVVVDLLAYWRSHPPVHEMVAAYLGVKPPPEPQPVSADDPSGIGALLAQFPGGFVPANRPG